MLIGYAGETVSFNSCPTIHNEEGEYHYHIQNERYLDTYYILFPGDYQGTPNNIEAG